MNGKTALFFNIKTSPDEIKEDTFIKTMVYIPLVLLDVLLHHNVYSQSTEKSKLLNTSDRI